MAETVPLFNLTLYSSYCRSHEVIVADKGPPVSVHFRPFDIGDTRGSFTADRGGQIDVGIDSASLPQTFPSPRARQPYPVAVHPQMLPDPPLTYL